jgi:glycosyltransferase involved in cell wall biosynthesis
VKYRYRVNPPPLRITFFVEGRQVPATRFRVLQYIPYLRELGHDVRICSTKPSKYLWYPSWIEQARIMKPLFVLPLLTWIMLIRLIQILRYAWRSEVIVIQRDLLHRDPSGILERFIIALTRPSCRIVFDVDDALFASPTGERIQAQEQKYRSLVPNYDLVIAGNAFLERFFSQFGPSRVVPTIIDTGRFTSFGRSPHRPLTIGWTGVSSNFRYLHSLVPTLRELQNQHGVKILIISDSDPSLENELAGLGLTWIQWSELEEVEQLNEIDIGIMPLDGSEWSRGKCGFKLLQYMSVGIPSVASPIGVNTEIIEHGVSGFLAATDREWFDCLTMLCNDAEFRIRMGDQARERVCQRYSLDAWRDTFTQCVIGLPALS